MSQSPDDTRVDPLADIPTLVQQVAQALTQRGWMLATAESCTGGMIAAACTDQAGSSAWFDRGVVSYSNEAKSDLLGVPPTLIAQHGAVSEPVALAMAQGMLQGSKAQIAVAVTGVAGPGGGSPEKPVGTVWLAWASQGANASALRIHAPGDRAAVRQATCQQALAGVLKRVAAASAAA